MMGAPLSTLFKQSLETFLDTSHLPKKLAVALSGGSDSMALALLALQWCNDHQITLTALTVDHGLREQSTHEAHTVAMWCQKHKLRHEILSSDSPLPHGNLQHQARNLRYQLMQDYCQAHDISFLLVGHTLNDQAETVLMRLMRGSGVDGLSAMSHSTKGDAIAILRPLLGVERHHLQEYLQTIGQSWIDDPSNDNKAFERVMLRKLIEQSNTKDVLIKRLANTATHMARSRSYIMQCIHRDMQQVITFHPEGYVACAYLAFTALHEESRLRILSLLLTHISGKYYTPRFEKLKHLHDRLMDDTLEKSTSLNGCIIRMLNNDNSFIIYREIADIHQQASLIANQITLWDGRFYCTTPLEGVHVQALGIKRYTYLKQEGVLHATTLRNDLAATLPAFVKDSQIIAIPTLHYYEEGFKNAGTTTVKPLKMKD